MRLQHYLVKDKKSFLCPSSSVLMIVKLAILLGKSLGSVWYQRQMALEELESIWVSNMKQNKRYIPFIPLTTIKAAASGDSIAMSIVLSKYQIIFHG